MEGEGVAPLEIPEIDKAIAKYEKRKEARVAESPGEIAAKKELKQILHQHRDKLPRNSDGTPFYRYEDTDYLLEEKLVRKSVAEPEEE